MIAGWDVGASEGALFDDSGQLSKLIERPATTLSVAVAEALQQALPAKAEGSEA
jgi:NAD(P)H dehydrogenase (quinone)